MKQTTTTVMDPDNDMETPPSWIRGLPRDLAAYLSVLDNRLVYHQQIGRAHV